MDELNRLFGELNKTFASFEAERPFLLDNEHLQAQIVMQAYVGATVDYLLTLSDPILRGVAEAFQAALTADRVVLRAEANLLQAAIDVGMAAHIAARHTFRTDRPTLLLPPDRQNGAGEPQSVALLPLALVGAAQAGRGVEMITAVLFLCSVVRDFVHGRFGIDRTAVPMRGEAMMAHWLIQNAPSYPLSDSLLGIMSTYPQGWDALPSQIAYPFGPITLEENSINLTKLAAEQAKNSRSFT